MVDKCSKTKSHLFSRGAATVDNVEKGMRMMGAVVDPRRALLALLNVCAKSANDRDVYNRANAFIETYGPLRETREERMPINSTELAEKVKSSALYGAFFGPPYIPQGTVMHRADQFSRAISLPHETQRADLNLTLKSIFESPVNIDGTEYRTALDIDIVSGTVEPHPRDLLDAIALELMRSRKFIARCALCSKYFRREFSKDKYCSPVCASEARRRGQSDWASKKRHSPEKQLTKKARKAH